ncbi:MAG: ribose-phosphate diphosphokinase [Nitrososphaerota archaeon]|nr:ribose-phosphate diphosphokinase [Candidatus Bathyarchaeota archaeon]MDW8022806.1 ribose-phosphate diphosphokinase [Nitrososphaerota archaeon]
MKVVIGPASKELGARIAQLLNVEPVQVFHKTFPDGESYVRLEGKVEDEDVAVVQTTSPPQDSRLMQLAFIADATKRNKAKRVVAVVPYFAYARQDKVFLQGEPVSIEAVARMLKAAGVDSLITVNVHQAKVLERLPIPAKNLSAVKLLAKHFVNMGLKGAFALAPDKGAIHIAEEAAEVLGGDYGYLEKQRDRYTGQVTVEKKTFKVEGKSVIIFDDIISTGGTIVAAAKVLKELGASRVYASCVHPLLVGDAEKRIREAGVEEIVGTDSVPSHVSKVSLAPLIYEELKELKSG